MNQLPCCTISRRDSHTIRITDVKELAIASNCRVPSLELGEGDAVFGLNGGAAVAGLNEVVLVAIGDDAGLRWPRWRNLGTRRSGTRHTNGISNDKVLAVAAQGWIPRVQLRECDAERGLDRRAAVSRLDRIVLHAACHDSGLCRGAGSYSCRCRHGTRRGWRGSGRRRRAGRHHRSEHADGVPNNEEVAIAANGRIPCEQLLERDIKRALDRLAAVLVLYRVVLLAAGCDAGLCRPARSCSGRDRGWPPAGSCGIALNTVCVSEDQIAARCVESRVPGLQLFESDVILVLEQAAVIVSDDGMVLIAIAGSASWRWSWRRDIRRRGVAPGRIGPVGRGEHTIREACDQI